MKTDRCSRRTVDEMQEPDQESREQSAVAIGMMLEQEGLNIKEAIMPSMGLPT